jgi:hypothetical protein
MLLTPTKVMPATQQAMPPRWYLFSLLQDAERLKSVGQAAISDGKPSRLTCLRRKKMTANSAANNISAPRII